MLNLFWFCHWYTGKKMNLSTLIRCDSLSCSLRLIKYLCPKHFCVYALRINKCSEAKSFHSRFWQNEKWSVDFGDRERERDGETERKRKKEKELCQQNVFMIQSTNKNRGCIKHIRNMLDHSSKYFLFIYKPKYKHVLQWSCTLTRWSIGHNKQNHKNHPVCVCVW